MNAVILAGGKGTRLRSLAEKIPKSMVRVGTRPILEHQINLLHKYGINNITIITGFLSNVIENYFQDGSRFDVTISYYKEKSPLGTTGGIKEIADKLTHDFIVLYGDVMVNMNLQELIAFHVNKQSACTLVVHPNDHPYDSDLVEINSSGRVTAFHSKPHPENIWNRNLVNAALYVMSPKILTYIAKGVKADFGRDLFPKIYNQLAMFGYTTAEYLKDVGTPERLAEVNADLASGKITRSNKEKKRKAIFLDRDGVINEEIGLLSKSADFTLLSDSGRAIRKINQSEYLAIVITNQSVVARNLCSIEELDQIHKKMETLLGRQQAKLDGIYYCPHHPDKGFPEENPLFKITCDCRKPKIGMIKQAEADFNIDLDGSFFIGDSGRDIACGTNAGLTTVGVRSGYGCKDSRVTPDYFFESPYEAVTYIVDNPYEEYITRIQELLSKKPQKTPFVISVGGNTRSGKTTFVRSLSESLRKQGCKVLTVSLDNWLLAHAERLKEHNVYDRFQTDKISLDLVNLLKNKEIVLKKYDQLSRQSTDTQIYYRRNDADIIIIEGIIALGTEDLRKIADLKIFCDIDAECLKKRVTEFYRWKGLAQKEIDALLSCRKDDEYSIIEHDSLYADIIITILHQ